MASSRATAWGLLGVQLILIVGVMFLPSGADWQLSESLSQLARIVSWLGLAVVLLGLLTLGRSVSPLPTPVAHGALHTGGLFRWVRHPVYSGLFLWAIASAVGSGSWVVAGTAAALVVWLHVKARWEERRLVERYPGYPDYMAATPRFIPWPRRSD